MQQAPWTELNLLDHLVGAGEDRGRNSDPKFLRRLQIDEEFEVRGLFRRLIRSPRRRGQVAAVEWSAER